jgi:hypothetical protein
LLLGGVQDEAAVNGALFPLGADEALPVFDVRRGPSGKALGAAGAMEGGRDEAGGAVAGRNDKAAVLQPDVYLLDIYAGTCLRKSPIPGLYAPWRRKSRVRSRTEVWFAASAQNCGKRDLAD